jgi:hypothetical protein
VSRIKVRNPSGSEFSFHTREEFSHEVVSGTITAEWEIFHTKANSWLSVSAHPAFQAIASRSQPEETRSPTQPH